MKQPRKHLTDDELIVAMVDAADLAIKRRSHLDDCRHCRQRLAAAHAPLDHIGALAEHYTPAPSHPVRIDARPSLPAKRNRRRVGIATAMAAMVLLVVVWTAKVGHDPSRFAGGSESGSDTDDMVFMAEVGRLVDDPLPDRYRSLIGSGITDSEDDFMDFIVPAVTGHAPTTRRYPAIGVSPC